MNEARAAPPRPELHTLLGAAAPVPQADPRQAIALERIAAAFERVAASLERLAASIEREAGK